MNAYNKKSIEEKNRLGFLPLAQLISLKRVCLPALPSLEDIIALKNYTEKLRRKSFNNLREGFNNKDFMILSQSTLISILIFNRKRPGDFLTLLVTTYTKTLSKITPKTNPDLYKKMTKTSKTVAQKYLRILNRGKEKNKIVRILLNEQMKECIDILLPFRKGTGILDSNPYIFALPGIQEPQLIEAGPLLTRYAEQCNAEIHKLLRG